MSAKDETAPEPYASSPEIIPFKPQGVRYTEARKVDCCASNSAYRMAAPSQDDKAFSEMLEKSQSGDQGKLDLSKDEVRAYMHECD